MHSKWDQSVLVLCLMYPLFEVFSKDRECKTKVYIFLPLWEQLLLHNVLIPLSEKKRKQKDLGFLFESCCCIVNTRPAADSWLELEKKERLKGRSALYGINLKKVDGPHVNTVTSPVLMDNHTPGKVSPTDSDWQIQEAVLLQCWMASPHNTGGVIRSCQSNMRQLTMTSLAAREWARLLMCIHWANGTTEAALRKQCTHM